MRYEVRIHAIHLGRDLQRHRVHLDLVCRGIAMLQRGAQVHQLTRAEISRRTLQLVGKRARLVESIF